MTITTIGHAIRNVTEPVPSPLPLRQRQRLSDVAIERVREILATVKPLAAEYYRLTGKPLGVTGEVAEYVAAETLGLVLADARTLDMTLPVRPRTARSAFR